MIKRSLFAAFFCVFAVSYLQLQFEFTRLSPLEGYMETVSRPYISASSWFNESYQQHAEKYINQQLGFRPVFVRIRNQVMYTLFNETPVKEIVIGKEQFLYEQNYILAYLGRDFIGKDSIDRQVDQLRKIQDTLGAKGIHFAVILAAGKASFFPEYIPGRFEPEKKSLSNYDYFAQKFRDKGVHHIDFNDWFSTMKDSSAYPLYPKYGIHWSKYGEALVADSIVHYIEAHTGMSLPGFVIDSIELSDTARDVDYDMAGAMNLLYKLPGYPLAYPKIRTRTDSHDVKLPVVVIGDSYFSSLSGNLLSGNVFSPAQFWFYNNHIYSSAVREVQTLSQIDPKTEIEKQRVVFILSTEANLNRLGFGAIDMLYNAYYRPELYHKLFQKRLERIEYWKQRIRDNEEWMRSTEEKSIERMIPLEMMLQMDAEYMVKQEGL